MEMLWANIVNQRERERERPWKDSSRSSCCPMNSHTEPSQQSLSGQVACFPIAEADYMLSENILYSISP
jgi:hypothetical protein